MMELSDLRRTWRESGSELGISACDKEEVMMLIKERSADLKKQIVKRLTTEINTYLLIGLFMLCSLVVREFTPRRALLLGAASLLLLAPVLGALAYKEYRLRTLSMSGSLRDSISMLIRAIDSTASLYLFAYVATIGLSIALIEILLVQGKGWNLLTICLVPIGFAVILWSYFSGRRYAERMFRAYRSKLVSVLNELESV
jgi:hypothetical protein